MAAKKITLFGATVPFLAYLFVGSMLRRFDPTEEGGKAERMSHPAFSNPRGEKSAKRWNPRASPSTPRNATIESDALKVERTGRS